MTTASRHGRALAWAIGAVLAGLLLRGILPPSQAPELLALCLALVGLGLLGAWRFRREVDRAPLHRDPGVFALVAALGVLLATLLSHDLRLTSDGIDHFVYLRSLWVDRDLDLANDYEAVSPRRASVDPTTPLGRTGNLHPVGPALVWSPFYVLADVVCRVTGRVPDGQGPAYRNAVALASLLYGWLGLLLLYRTAAPRCGRGPALLASLGIGFGTFLYWYLAFAPTMAHAPAFAAAALVVWLWLRSPGEGPATADAQDAGTRETRRLRRAAWLGAACGLAALLRWSNGVLALLVLLEALPRLRRPAEWPGLLREGAAFALAALAVFSPQMLVWKLLYGSWLTIPQGAAFVAGGPAWAGVLFSPRHGLFSWSPLLYLGLLGLLLLARREPPAALGGLALLAVLTRLNAGVADWWGGAAFGARRFDAALPLLGLGLAVLLAWGARAARRRPLLAPGALLAAFVLWNLLLADQYRTGAWDYAEPVAFEDMGRGAASALDRAIGSPFALPASLFEWLRSGRAPADWESLYMERRFSRWSARMGVDERMFLEDGWSPLAERQGVPCRLVRESAGLVIPLHRAASYRFGARLALAAPQGRLSAPTGPAARVRVVVNQRPVGTLAVSGEWSDASVDVPAEVLQSGRNAVRLRVLDLEGERAVAVAGLWLEPS